MVIEHLSSIRYAHAMRLKNYIKIDGRWYRSLCDNCNTPLQNITASLCRGCYKDSLRGIIRVSHNKPHTKATKELIRQKKTKTDLTYSGIHQWLWREFPREQICQNLDCVGKSSYYDWACVTGEYKKDIKNYRRLCRSCHKLFDKGKIKLRLEIVI